MEIAIDRKLTARARKIIRQREELQYITDAGIRFTVLKSDEEKKKDRKTVFGLCEKVQEKYKWKIPYDFLIYVYEINCENQGFDEHQYDILLEHELRHIGVDMGGAVPKYYIVPHDIEDFWSIINRYGWYWQVQHEQQ